MVTRAAAFLVLLAIMAAGGASASGFNLPESDAVPGWERHGPLRRFTAADLYGHINGGAELFLELGFSELVVQPYVRGEQEIAIEVYRMESPMSALAVYLFKCGEETPWPEIGERNSSTRFQAVILRGDCFVLVNSFSGDRSLRPEMTGLAGALLKSIPPTDPVDPFDPLSAAGRIAGSERLIRGEYSLQSLYTLGPGDVLQLGGRIFGAAADYDAPDGGAPETLIRVAYPDAAQAAGAFSHLLAVLDPTLESLGQTGSKLVFRDYAGRYGQVELNGRTIDIRVNLPSTPLTAADTPAGS